MRTAVYSRHFDKTKRIVVRYTATPPLPVDQDNLCDKYYCLIGFPIDNVILNDYKRFKVSLSDLRDLSNLPKINIKKWMIKDKRPIIKAWYRHSIIDYDQYSNNYHGKYQELGHNKSLLINGYIRFLWSLKAFQSLRFPASDIILMITLWHDGNYLIEEIFTLITAFCIQHI